MRKAIRFAMLVCGACMLAGCLGKAGPEPVYMRLELTEAKHCKTARPTEFNGVLLIAVKELTGLPGLERQSVLLSDGQVLQPSTTWYWEAPPAQIMGQALANGLGCHENYSVIYPYRPMVRRDAVLSGHVTSFDVDKREQEFSMALRLDLWSEDGRTLLATESFQAQTPVGSMNPKRVTRAADQAMLATLQDALQWLKTATSGRM